MGGEGRGSEISLPLILIIKLLAVECGPILSQCVCIKGLLLHEAGGNLGFWSKYLETKKEGRYSQGWPESTSLHPQLRRNLLCCDLLKAQR